MKGTESKQPPASAWSLLLREAWPGLLIVLAACLVFREAVLLRGAFFHYDHALQNFPFRQFFARGLARGRLPLWSSELFCGFPLFAEGQANALYPPFIVLFGLFRPWVAYNYYTVLHYALAGVSAYALGRTLRIFRGGAFLAGLAYMLSGPVLFHAHHTNIVVSAALLPLLLAFIEMACRRRTVPWFLGVGSVTGLLLLGGQPQYVLYNALTCAIFAGWRLALIAQEDAPRPALRVAMGLAGGALLGALLACAQLLPTLELVLHTSRGAGGLAGVSPGVPGNLLTLFLPFAFGSPGFGSYWGAVDPGLHSELTLFVGTATLMLALVGAFADRSRRALFLTGLGLFAFVFSLGFHGSIYNLLGFLPVFGASRFPSRYAYVLAICVALLAAIGLQHLHYSRRRERIHALAMKAAVVMLCLSLAAIIAVVIGQGRLPGLDAWELARELPFTNSFERDAVWRYLHDTFQWDVWRLAGVVATATGLLLLAARRVGPRRALTALWCALILVELAHVGREFTVVTDPSIYTAQPELVEALKELPPGRVMRYRYYDKVARPRWRGDYPFTPGWAAAPAEYARSLDRMPANSNLLWDVPSLSGFSPLQTVQLKALLGRRGSQSTIIEHDLGPVLDLLNVRYVLSPRWELAAPGYRRIRRVGSISVFENADALPRAFIIHGAERAPADEEAVELLRSPGFDYRRRLLVHGADNQPHAEGPAQAGPGEVAAIEEDTGDRVVVSAELDRPGYLVLADQYYPGWRVTVDGRPAELLRVDYMLRGVSLPAGSHEVVFSFRPRSLRFGALLSAAGLLILLGGVVHCVLRPGEARDDTAWGLRYARRTGRLVAVFGLIFVVAGPVLRPRHWADLPRQLTPHNYAAKFAALSAGYETVDGRPEVAVAILADAVQWWPGNGWLRELLARYSAVAYRALLADGRAEQAAEVAATAHRLAPEETARFAPELSAVAENAAGTAED